MKFISPTESMPVRPLKITIYGPSGSGKTTLSYTAKKACLLAAESGAERSYQEIRTFIIVLESWKETKQSLEKNELQEFIKSNGYQTIIIDTVGTLIQDQITKYVISLGGKLTTKNGTVLSMDGWGLAAAEFDYFVSKLTQLGVDIVFLAHDKEEGKDQKTGLDIQGQARGMIAKHCDLIGYIFADGSGQRWIDFNGSEDKQGKNPPRFPKMRVPMCSTSGEFPTFLASLVDKTKLHMFSMTQAQKDAEAKLTTLKTALPKAKTNEDFNSLMVGTDQLPTSFKLAGVKLVTEAFSKWYNEKVLGGIKEASDLNLVVTEFKELSENYRAEIKSAAATAIRDKSKTLGFVYNKETISYEDPEKDEDAE